MTAKKSPGEFYRVEKQVANEYPVVEGTRCVQVKIPDDTSFLPVLAAMVASLGNTWSSIGGVEARRLWAEMWQRAYAETDWSACMNCDELVACLTPLFEAQTANILTLINNLNQYGTSTPGLPMTTEERTANLVTGTNPECNLDILWAQCLSLIQFTNRAATDIFERIEAASNVVELAGLSGEIPVVGLVLQLFGEELATETINYYQEALQEGYEAEYTEDEEIELACQLFCMFNVDCYVSIDGIYDVFYGNVSDEVPSDPIEWVQLLLLLAGVDVTADTVVDLVFWCLWGMAKLGHMMFKDVTTVSLEMLLRLAVDDASPDWEILCTDCFNLCRLEFNQDNEPDDFVIVTGDADLDFWISSEPSSGTDYIVYTCDNPVPGDIIRIRLYFADNLPKSCQYVIDGNTYALNGTPKHAGGGVYVLTGEVPNLTGNFEGILARQDIGNTQEFFLLGTTIVYEC